MIWYGVGGLIWLVLLLTLGIITLRKGHGWLFFFGLFIPLFWLMGALMPDRRHRYA